MEIPKSSLCSLISKILIAKPHCFSWDNWHCLTGCLGC